MSDPNTFLSSVSQAAAAIVGLLGAFLITRIAAFASDSAHLRRRLAVAADQIEEAALRTEYIHLRLARLDLSDLLRDHEQEILKSRGSVSLEQLIGLDDRAEMSKFEFQSLQMIFGELVTTIARAFSELTPVIEAADEREPFRAFMRNNSIDLPEDAEKVAAYEAVFDRLWLEKKLSETEPLTSLRSFFGASAVAAGDLDESVRNSIENARTRDLLTDELSSIERGLIPLFFEQSRAEEERDALVQLPGVWNAIGAIGYLSIVGVIWPIWLMPAPPNSFDNEAIWSLAQLQVTGASLRMLIIGALFIGLVWVSGYFIWAVLSTKSALASDESETSR